VRSDLSRLADQLNSYNVAVIDYLIVEEVLGRFMSPFAPANDGTPTTMKFAFRGRGEFAIEGGYWLEYNGLMSMEASGVMKANQKQKLSLLKQ